MFFKTICFPRNLVNSTNMLSKINTFIFLILSCFPFCNIYSQGWTQLVTTGNITSRSNASAIYIAGTNKMIVFGGVTASGPVNDIWSLDLNTNQWSVIPTTSTLLPDPRYTHVSMFDSISNRMLVWSGNGNTLYNDIWAFNFNDSTWQELFPDGNVSGAPLKRYGVASVFDPLNRNIISFAGFTTSGRFDDTWSFNVDNQSWTERTNLDFPLRRCLTSQCFAPERREMIVFGGQSTGNLNDIWSLNVDNFTWTNHIPLLSPVARHFTSLVYCGNGNVVVFGGDSLNQGNTSGAMNDLLSFSLDSQTWNTIPQDSIKPSARYGHTYIYIPSQDKMIIFGGQGTSALNAETWVYGGISSFLNTVNEKPNNISLLKCSPNPTLDKTTISFFLAQKSLTTINILNVNGKIISTLINTELNPGNHSINYSNFNLSPGIYLCTLKTEKFIETIRLVILENGN